MSGSFSLADTLTDIGLQWIEHDLDQIVGSSLPITSEAHSTLFVTLGAESGRKLEVRWSAVRDRDNLTRRGKKLLDKKERIDADESLLWRVGEMLEGASLPSGFDARERFLLVCVRDLSREFRSKMIQMTKVRPAGVLIVPIYVSRDGSADNRIEGFLSVDSTDLGALDQTARLKFFVMLADVIGLVLSLILRVYTDWLTGVWSRTFLEDKGAALLSGKEGVAVAYMDLNRFKRINDEFGHTPHGDAVLRGFSSFVNEHVIQALRSVGRSAWLGRHGGDEFVIIASSDARRDLESIIRRSLEGKSLIYDGVTETGTERQAEYSTCIGIGSAVEGGASKERIPSRWEEVLRYAEVCQQVAKYTWRVLDLEGRNPKGLVITEGTDSRFIEEWQECERTKSPFTLQGDRKIELRKRAACEKREEMAEQTERPEGGRR